LSSKQSDFSVQLGQLSSDQKGFSERLGQLSGGFGTFKWAILVIVAIIVGFSVYVFNGRFDALEASVNGRFDALEARMNSRFDALEARMNGKFDTLEAKVAGLSSRMADFESRMNGLGTRMDTLFATVMEMRKDIDGLKVAAGAPATSGSARRCLRSDAPADPASPGTATPGPTARAPSGPGEHRVE
jgi:hypothetical protein